MIYCDRCDQPTRTVVPVLAAGREMGVAEVENRPLPRAALQALGWPEPPWGEHPDDNMFESWCEDCAQELAASRRGHDG